MIVLLRVLVNNTIWGVKIEMTQFTEFGRDVKKALIDAGETQDWLMKRIKDSTGLFVDNGYIYKILTGQRNAPKIVQAIREILDLPEQDQDTA